MSIDVKKAREVCKHFALVDVREILPAALDEIERLRALVKEACGIASDALHGYDQYSQVDRLTEITKQAEGAR